MVHCITCPFGDYSKIPDSIKNGANYDNQIADQDEVLKYCNSQNINWTCHDNFDRVCAGYVAFCKENGIEYRGKQALGDIHDLKEKFGGNNYVPY